MRITCPQCGGFSNVAEKDPYVLCSFCGTSLAVLLDSAARHQWLKPSLGEDLAVGALKRWLAERELAGRFIPGKIEKFFFPLWFVYYEAAPPFMELGASTEYWILRELPPPKGEMQLYAPHELEGEKVVPPDVCLPAVLEKASQKRPNLKPVHSLLCHIPLYRIEYTYEGQGFSALIEGSQGSVLAYESPLSPRAEKDRSYGLLMFGTLSLFFLEGLLIPGIGRALFAGGATALAAFGLLSYHMSRRGGRPS